MYKLLMIDDEEPVREAIRILGDWASAGITEIFEAKHGREALELLERHSIDIALIDMKMPEMSGLEFLQQIEQTNPELLTIVISGYNDFEYTRQAIRSKVVDYLLKPINRQELNNALRKATDLLGAKHQEEHEFINRNIALNLSLPKLKEKVYWSYIDRSQAKHTNEAVLSLIGADHSSVRYLACVVRLMNMEQVKKKRFNGDSELLRFSATNVLSETSGGSFTAFSFVNPKREHELIIVLTVTGGLEQDVMYYAYHGVNKSVQTLHSLFGLTAVAGLGFQAPALDGLADSYDTACRSVLSANLLRLKHDNSTVLPAKPESPQQRHLHHEKLLLSIASTIQKLRGAMEAGNSALAASVIDEQLKSWHAGGQLTIGEAERILSKFVIMLNDICLELGVESEKLPVGGQNPLLFMQISSDYASFEQFGQLLQDVLDYYVQCVRSANNASYPFRIEQIKEYIDNHYFEDIKISMFSDKYFLSREYLMKLFKSEYGYGIYEYVLKVRMDKARELLSNPDLKIQDISELLGYKDKNYFSKAFRNYFAMSPSEYRHALQKDGNTVN
ncbi:response regulator [Marinicrinis lubricantis]|uniref:Response regulator n=1 Tax=Marinicrinis lubricantis TaxID=2086470 RepID=A0ABW1IPV4_9BACL